MRNVASEVYKKLDTYSKADVVKIAWKLILERECSDIIFQQMLRAFTPFNSQPKLANVSELMHTCLINRPRLQFRGYELTLYQDKRTWIKLSTLPSRVSLILMYIYSSAQKFFRDVRNTFGSELSILMDCVCDEGPSQLDIVNAISHMLAKLCLVNVPQEYVMQAYDTMANSLCQMLASADFYLVKSDWPNVFKENAPVIAKR